MTFRPIALTAASRPAKRGVPGMASDTIMRCRHMTTSLSGGWQGVVLDAAPDLPGAFGAGEASDQVQCHVDTGADTGRGDEVAVVDPAVGWADLHGGVKPAQLVHRSPVGRRRPLAEQPGSSVDQSASADTGHQRDGRTLGADPLEVFRVAQKPPGTFAAWVYQHLQGWCVRDGVVCAQNQAFGSGHRQTVLGHAGHGAAVVWVVSGPVGQYFPRADGVELFDAVEQQDGDVVWQRAGLVGHVLSVPQEESGPVSFALENPRPL